MPSTGIDDEKSSFHLLSVFFLVVRVVRSLASQTNTSSRSLYTTALRSSGSNHFPCRPSFVTLVTWRFIQFGSRLKSSTCSTGSNLLPVFWFSGIHFDPPIVSFILLESQRICRTSTHYLHLLTYAASPFGISTLLSGRNLRKAQHIWVHPYRMLRGQPRQQDS